jgi:hypothetical protein
VPDQRDDLRLRGEREEAIDLRPSYHDLHRTSASALARAGMGRPVIEKVLNHVSDAI